MTKAKKQPTFEKNLEQLEATVAALEEGGLTLEDSLKHFEEGIKLARLCEQTLAEAERKIEILTKNAAGELEAKPFGDEGNNETKEDVSEGGEEGSKPGEEEELLF